MTAGREMYADLNGWHLYLKARNCCGRWEDSVLFSLHHCLSLLASDTAACVRP